MLEPPNDEFFMREALRLAKKAAEAGEVPVGAVVVRAGKIIARASNQVELLKDATAHAEMLVLTQAEAAVGDWRLTECDLYTRAHTNPTRDFRLHRSIWRRCGKRDQPSENAWLQSPLRYRIRCLAK